jgi:hypothetical protein
MLVEPSGPKPRQGSADGIHLKLEHPDGTPADPPTIRSAVPTWAPGDRIRLGPNKPALLVVGIRIAHVYRCAHAQEDAHAGAHALNQAIARRGEEEQEEVDLGRTVATELNRA